MDIRMSREETCHIDAVCDNVFIDEKGISVTPKSSPHRKMNFYKTKGKVLC